MVSWKRNLAVLCGAQLLTLIGFSAYLPFIPYYIQENLGVTDEAQALAWLAVFNSGSAIAMMIAAPIWGTLSDRYGRKMMLLRATAFGALLAFGMGVVKTPLQLNVLRVMQGAFCGTVAAAMTLAATGTPEKNLGFALGMMQTIQFAGQALGPLVGGYAADLLGYRAVFPISAGLMAISFVAVLALVQETFQRSEAPKRKAKAKLSLGALRETMGSSAIVLLVALSSTAFATSVISPVLSLYIKALNPDTEHMATIAGAVTSAVAFTSSGAAFFIGRMGDRWGQKIVLVFCVVGAMIIHIPQAFVANAMQLLALRTIQGIFMGGMMPTANALLARSVDKTRRGMVFGLSASVQAGGRAVGPVAGAAVASAWGMTSVFLVTGAIFGLSSAMIGALVHTPAAAEEEEATTPAQVEHAEPSACPPS